MHNEENITDVYVAWNTTKHYRTSCCDAEVDEYSEYYWKDWHAYTGECSKCEKLIKYQQIGNIYEAK